MAEPLTVDSARLKVAGSKLAGISLPVSPPLVAIADGTDSVSKAVNELMPLMEAPVTDSLPTMNAALSQTGTSIALAADRYAETDQLLGENFAQDPIGFDQASGGLPATGRHSAGLSRVQGNPVGVTASTHETDELVLGTRTTLTQSVLSASDSGSDAAVGVAAGGIRPIGFIAGSMYATSTAVTAAQDLLQGVQSTAQGVQSFVSSVSSDAGQPPAQLVSDTNDDDSDDAAADQGDPAADGPAAGPGAVDSERVPVSTGSANGGETQLLA